MSPRQISHRPGRLSTRLHAALLGLLFAPLVAATPEKAATYYEDALARYERNDVPGAIIQLKNAVQQDNRMVAAHLLLGKALLRNGELKPAEASFEQALKLGVNRSEVAVPLGRIFLTLGQPERVIDRISADGLPPAVRVEVLAMRGTAYAELGRERLAAEAFAEARLLDPKSIVPLLAEIPVLLAAGNVDRAATLAAQAIKLAPESAPAWNMQASVLHAKFDLANALAAYDRVLAIEPRHLDARVARAGLMFDLRRDAEAAKDLDFLKQSAPGEPRAAYLRALLASRQDDPAAVNAALGEAVKLVDALPRSWLAGRTQLLMLGALSHYGLRNLERSREYLDLVIKREPRHVGARKLLASIYVQTRDYTRALTLLGALQKELPNDPQVLYQLGSVHLAQRRYVAATEALERAAAQLGSAEANRALGLSQLGLGQNELGLANLEKSFAADPGNAGTGTTLAMLYMQRGEPKKALQTAEAMVKRDAANLTALNFLGVIRGAAGDRAGAREAYRQALAKDPNFRPAALNLARLDVGEGRFDDARRQLEQMLAKQRDDHNVIYELGLLEQRAGRIDDAVRHLQRAADIQRRDPRAGLALVDLLLGQRQADKAVEVARELSGRHRGSLAAQVALGRAYLAIADSTQARAAFNDATRLADFDPSLQVMIGRLQLAAGYADGAYYNAQKALQGRPDDADALALMVEVEARRGDAAKADAALKQLGARHPKSLQLATATGDLAMIRGQHAAAVTAYKAALAHAETTGNAINVARAHLAAGEAGKAASFLDEWVGKHPQDLVALKGLAEAQYRARQLTAARDSYARAASLDPRDGDLLNNYANLLLELNEPAALAQAEQAVKLDPNNAFYTGTLGWVLVQQGQVTAGLRHLRDARLRRPDSGEIRFRLAYALAKAGREAEARDELQAALATPGPWKGREDVAALKRQLGL